MALLSGELTDEKGRLVRPVLFNTAKDGSGTWLFALLDADGHLQVDSLSALPAGTNIIGKVEDSFGGNVYSKTMTMSDDAATRFETEAKLLRDVVILVETYSMLLGKTGVEVYTVGVGETVGFTKVEISTLYFKNATAGQNGKISILAVEE